VAPKPEDFFITHLKRQGANAFGMELGFGVLFGYSLGFSLMWNRWSSASSTFGPLSSTCNMNQRVGNTRVK
jgi:hypothetical protein